MGVGASTVTPNQALSLTDSAATQQKTEKYHNNIEKRGKVEVKKKDSLPINPYVLAFIVFVVVGSSLLQIFRGQ
ncbi:hypothetical protein SAMD00019534_099370 [Acytostelium subglobosum LB1]|uniref:hypothetical protein n=1 Tax=Acytostelium subglobosum LB1 TaxID=1410327 RepID=UPI000644F4C5|nr:hypothetical protein SAMD00019534_099370 [Acytostelium subglobosum LB1]GAM26762.1 hypothetical protein SAMD00019534_099370 [Acytostelium subglobosum LB1]|eukprot:XP_012750423.1 hypothetical protein SAMD00019534_099370 [Acytostelium subglobosum LB1]